MPLHRITNLDPWSTLSCNQGALEGCVQSLRQFLRSPSLDKIPKFVLLIIGEPGAGRSSFLRNLLDELRGRQESLNDKELRNSTPVEQLSARFCRDDRSNHPIEVLNVERHVGSNRLALADMICSLKVYPGVLKAYNHAGRSHSSIQTALKKLVGIHGFEVLALHDLDSYAVVYPNINKNDLALMMRLPSIRALVVGILNEHVDWMKDALKEINVEYQHVVLQRMRNDTAFELFVADTMSLYGKGEPVNPSRELLSQLYIRSHGRVGKLVEWIKLEMVKGGCAFKEPALQRPFTCAALEGESFSSWLSRVSLIGNFECKVAVDQLMQRHAEAGLDIDFAFKDELNEHLFDTVFSGQSYSNSPELAAQQKGLNSVAKVIQDDRMTYGASALADWFDCQSQSLRALGADGRYCPMCLCEDIRRIGSPAWRFAWRRPYICVCDLHTVPVLLQRLTNPQATLMNRAWSAFVEYHNSPAARLEADFPLTVISFEECKAANSQLLSYALRVQRWIRARDGVAMTDGPSIAAIEFLLSLWLYQPGALKALGFAQFFFYAGQRHVNSPVPQSGDYSEIRLGYENATPRQVAVAFWMLGVAFDLILPEEAAFICRTCRGHALPFPANRDQLAASGQSQFIPTELDRLRYLARENLSQADQLHVMWALRRIVFKTPKA